MKCVRCVLVLSAILVSDACFGMRAVLQNNRQRPQNNHWSSKEYIGSDERPQQITKPQIEPTPIRRPTKNPMVQQKSPEQLAAERKQRREQIWQNAYERAYLRVLCTGNNLSIGIGGHEYTLFASNKEILIEDLNEVKLSKNGKLCGMLYKKEGAAGSIIPAIDNSGQSVMDDEGNFRNLNPEDTHFNDATVPFKITEQKDKTYKIEYNGNDTKLNLVWKVNLTWNTNGTVIINNICCAIEKIPVYMAEMLSRSFAIKAAKVIMTGNNAADEITVSADDRIINCGELFCAGDCKLISDKIANYGLISDGDSGKSKNDEAKFVKADKYLYDIYETYPNLFNLPAKNGFYNFGTLNLQSKYVSTEDLAINLVGSDTLIKKTLTQTGNDCILRIINGDFYKSAVQETLKKEKILHDVSNQRIHIGGLLTGTIYTNVLAQKDLRNNGKEITLRNGSAKIYVKLLSMPEMRYDDTKLTVDNLNKPKILSWDKRRENVVFELNRRDKTFNPSEEIAHISGIEESTRGNKGEYDISIGQYGNSVYLVDGVWRKSLGATGWLGEFGKQLAGYLSTNKNRVNFDGNIYNLHEYLLGDTDSKKKPKTGLELILCVASNSFSNDVKEYYELKDISKADVVYDNFLVRIFGKDSKDEYSYVMTCNVSVDPEGKASVTEYLSNGALSEEATKIVIGKLNKCRSQCDL